VDKYQLLAGAAPDNTWAIIGRPADRDFLLFKILEAPAGEVLDDYARRGFDFIGCVSIIGGRPQTQFALPLDAAALDVLGEQVCAVTSRELAQRIGRPEIVAERAKQAAFDFYMRSLMKLPDERDA